MALSRLISNMVCLGVAVARTAAFADSVVGPEKITVGSKTVCIYSDTSGFKRDGGGSVDSWACKIGTEGKCPTSSDCEKDEDVPMRVVDPVKGPAEGDSVRIDAKNCVYASVPMLVTFGQASFCSTLARCGAEENYNFPARASCRAVVAADSGKRQCPQIRPCREDVSLTLAPDARRKTTPHAGVSSSTSADSLPATGGGNSSTGGSSGH